MGYMDSYKRKLKAIQPFEYLSYISKEISSSEHKIKDKTNYLKYLCYLQVFFINSKSFTNSKQNSNYKKRTSKEHNLLIRALRNTFSHTIPVVPDFYAYGKHDQESGKSYSIEGMYFKENFIIDALKNLKPKVRQEEDRKKSNNRLSIQQIDSLFLKTESLATSNLLQDKKYFFLTPLIQNNYINIMESYYDYKTFSVESKAELEREEELIYFGVPTLTDKLRFIKGHTEDIKKYLSKFPTSILTL